jgi:hypothetical protein
LTTDPLDVTDVQQFSLSQADRVALVGLTTHPGFRVLIQMMESACKDAYTKVIQCDPTKEADVLALQKEARAASAFSNLLLRAINWHSRSEQVVKTAA